VIKIIICIRDTRCYNSNPCPLWDNNHCPLWATTLILCRTTTLILCGQQLLSSVGNNPCPLWDNNPYPLWTATLVLCGTATLVLCGTHHPLWLPFRLIGWFSLWLGFRLSFGDSLGQGCDATILGCVVCVATLDPIPFNELIFGLGFF
jgi:hypothetical protein